MSLFLFKEVEDLANLVWTNVKGDQSVKEPFLSYRNKTDTKSFQRWLLEGYKNDSAETKHFGSHNYGNVLAEIKSAQSNSDISRDKITASEKSYLQKLKTLKANLEAAEKRLYSHFKNCKDFNQFKYIWQSAASYSKNDNNKLQFNKWMNNILNTFVGENQRFIGSKTRTLIEQIFSLVEIRLDSLGYYGFENSKNKFKKELVEKGMLFILSEEEAKDGYKYDRYLENKKYESDNALFIEELYEYCEKKYEETQDNVAYQIMATLADMFGTKNKKDVSFEVGKRSIGRMKRFSTKSDERTAVTVQGVFTPWPSKDKLSEQSIIDTLCDYARRVLAFTLSDNDYQDWLRYLNTPSGKQIFIQLQNMMKKYFKTHKNDYSNYIYNASNISPIQGLMGEIAAFGKSEFNLRSALKKDSVNNMNIINLGTLMNSKGWESGSDMVITFGSETYGFQVKNPFNVNADGKYSTYEKSWNLGKDKSISELYNDYFNFTAEQQEFFELLNVNLTTSINADALERQIIQFLYYFSNEFIRLNEDEIALDVQKKQEENVSDTISVRNIFFVLKGQLIQSSAIVEGLIEQFQFFAFQSRNKMKDYTNPVLKIDYTNNVKPNVYIEGDAAIPGAPFDRNLIETGSEYRNELANIKFSTALKLEIPGLTHFMNIKG